MIKISEELLYEMMEYMEHERSSVIGQKLCNKIKTLWLASKSEEDAVHLRLNLMNESLKRIEEKHDNDVKELHNRIDRIRPIIENFRNSVIRDLEAINIHISELKKEHDNDIRGISHNMFLDQTRIDKLEKQNKAWLSLHERGLI